MKYLVIRSLECTFGSGEISQGGELFLLGIVSGIGTKVYSPNECPEIQGCKINGISLVFMSRKDLQDEERSG